MEIIILHQTFTDGDAIGHDIQGMYDVCNENNINVSIFCEYNQANQKYKVIAINELKRKINTKNNILIYHHSIYWKLGESFLKEAKCKVIIRYHNITPSKFFENYSDKYYKITSVGREQTKRLIKEHDFYWLSDSNFNNLELLELGINPEKTEIVAPFHKVEYMDDIEADINLLNNLKKSSRVHVLFVGRVATNKGHLNICKVAKSYLELFDNNITFWIVGGFDPEIESYNKEINNYITRWNLQEYVIFTNKVSINQLKAYFLGSNIFLCLSEHEGFCVPLIESQYNNLPIVAYNSSAIAETMGDGQIVFEKFDEDLIAAAIFEIGSDKSIASYLAEKGKYNYSTRFKNEIISEQFINFIKMF
ncbi:glycosyltransferase [Paenibacillus radicis (ex Xue et al. 2023)]|uniref:Glycosyltransferase n=1 Tax=Paenibacillus radicis (ex Xue et al. 2023) TaxID=2972489 RepID=A0ABT1YS26_9BACL|nr:glycosyltransferase [Paenibacillus radicis (ex Xue et al. 2023)]MCR8635977.1 glycosyltransferase [Paenibacillus radicis (ex Xue et al. 2023)]